MDRRQRKTREAIFRAFTDLLTRESYSRITIAQIIQEADVGRTTFYAHFETKDDLLRAVWKEIFDHVLSRELTGEATHDFSHEGSLGAAVTHVLYHLRDSRRYLRGLLSEGGEGTPVLYFKEYMAVLLEKYVREAPAGVPEDYVLNHLVCDFVETVRWWMRHPEYSPEEIGSFFLTAASFLPDPAEA